VHVERNEAEDDKCHYEMLLDFAVDECTEFRGELEINSARRVDDRCSHFSAIILEYRLRFHLR
jgi:hypothetical protein